MQYCFGQVENLSYGVVESTAVTGYIERCGVVLLTTPNSAATSYQRESIMKGILGCFVAMALLGVSKHDVLAQLKNIDEIIEGLESFNESKVMQAMLAFQQKPENAEKAVSSLTDHLDGKSPQLIVEAGVALVHIDKDHSERVIKRLLSEPRASSYASRFWVTHPEPSIKYLSDACSNPSTESTALKALQTVLQVVRGRPYTKTPEYLKQVEITAGKLSLVFEDEDLALDSRMTAAMMYSELTPDDAFRTLPVVLDAITSNTNYSYQAAGMLRPVMEDVTPILLSEFGSHPWPSTTATSIANILATNYATSYPLVIDAGQSSDAAVRHGVAITLGQSAIANYRRETTGPVLTTLLNDEDAGIRAVTCRTVVDHYPELVEKAVPVVFALLDEVDERVQVYTILKVLSDIGQKAATQPSDSVVRLLSDNGDASLSARAAVAVMNVWPKDAPMVFPQVGKMLEEAKGYSGETVSLVKAVASLGKDASPLKPNLIKCFDGLAVAAGRRLPTTVLEMRYEICQILLSIEPDEAEHLDRMLEIVEAVPYGTRDAQGRAVWTLVERKDTRDKVRDAFVTLMENRSIYAREMKLDAAAGLLVLFPAEKEKAVKTLRENMTSNRQGTMKALGKAGKHAEPLMKDVAVFLRPGSSSDLKLALDIIKNIGPPAKEHIGAIEMAAKTTTEANRRAAEEAIKSIRGE